MTPARSPIQRWLTRLLKWGVFAVALCLALVTGAWLAIWMSSRPAEISVPDLVGLTEDEARGAAGASGLPVEFVGERADELVAAGLVALQEPVAGSAVRPGRTIRVIRSLGQPEISVPALIGRSAGEARHALEQEGLSLGTVSAVRWAQGEDRIIAQHPAEGARRSNGDPVDLLVSVGGRERVYVTPDLSGLAASDAVRWLTAHGLRPPTLRTESNREARVERGAGVEGAAGVEGGARFEGGARVRGGARVEGGAKIDVGATPGEAAGFVVAQSPAPGDPLRARQAMTLTVSP